MKAEIKGRLLESQKHLDGLGPERGSASAQLAYLTSIAARLQRLRSLALSSNFGTDNVFEGEPALRLAPAVMARMNTFSDEMRTSGHTFSFLHRGADPLSPQNDDYSASPAADEVALESPDNEGACSEIEDWEYFAIRKEDDIEELQDILQSQDSQRQPEPSGIKDWLREVFQDHRGFEMGTFNASILATVMKKQSSKWAVMSMACVSDAIMIVHRFIGTALKSICTNEQVCRALMDTIFEDLVQGYKEAIKNSEFILKVERNGTPMTLNHYFNDNLQKRLVL